MIARNKAVALLAVCFLTCGIAYASAQRHAFDEYRVKAAFLYNFAKFVEWPATAFESSAAPVSICILGNDPFGDAIEVIRTKTVGGRKLDVRRLSGLNGLPHCHILFISASEGDRLAEILKLIRKRDILTVADMKGFARAGGIINLVRKNETIQFEINLDAVERTDLKISSQLLKLAEIIRDGEK